MDLWQGDDLDERMGHAVEVEEMRRWRILLRLGGVLFQLDLLDVDADALPVFGRNSIIVVEVHESILCEGLYMTVSLASNRQGISGQTNRSIV